MKAASGIYGWYFSGKHPLKGTSASEKAVDALSCAKGPICYRVLVRGPITYEYRRFNGLSRRVVYSVDCTNILPQFIRSIYEMVGIRDFKNKSHDVWMNAWLSAIDVSGRTHWEIINGVLEQYIRTELEKKKVLDKI